MTPPHLTRVHDPDDVKTELAAALDVVDSLGPPDDLRVSVFQVAASALLLRVADPRPTPIPEALLRGLPGRD